MKKPKKPKPKTLAMRVTLCEERVSQSYGTVQAQWDEMFKYRDRITKLETTAGGVKTPNNDELQMVQKRLRALEAFSRSHQIALERMISNWPDELPPFEWRNKPSRWQRFKAWWGKK